MANRTFEYKKYCFVQLRKVLYKVISRNSEFDQPLPWYVRKAIEEWPLQTRKELMEKRINGSTFLGIACQKGKVRVAEYLIQVCGANIEQKAKSIQLDDGIKLVTTPLGCACLGGSLEAVKCLLRLGANVNGASECGSSPLHTACLSNNFAIVEYLVQNRADVLQQTYKGETCLMKSAHSPSISKFLISRRANVNACDVRGNTALHYAIHGGYLETIKLLLDERADPLCVNRDGDDALQLACIKSEMYVVLYLLADNTYSLERRADVFELFGATVVDLDNTVTATYNWHIAHLTRSSGGNYIRKQPEVSPRHAFGNAVEYSTENELLGITMNVDAARIQGLLIYERILGIRHECTLQYLMDKGSLYADSQHYQRCIDLWLLALQVRVEKHSILHSDTCVTARAIVGLMVHLLFRHNTYIPRFDDVHAVFQTLFSNIIETTHLLEIQPIDWRQQMNYDSIIHCMAYLIYLLLQTVRNENELTPIKSSVQDLVNNGVKDLSKKTLLHLTVTKLGTIDSAYFSFNDPVQIFPDVEVVRLLLKCGANPNARDNTKSTPLHIASVQLNPNMNMVRTLIAHGAHLDQPDQFGETAFRLLTANPANDINLRGHIPLSCMCASAIAKLGVPYRNILPRRLADLVQNHEP